MARLLADNFTRGTRWSVLTASRMGEPLYARLGYRAMSRSPSTPYDRWASLRVAEIVEHFAGAPFTWGLAGGYEVEKAWVGRSAPTAMLRLSSTRWERK
jgi:hypothetical protein